MRTSHFYDRNVLITGGCGFIGSALTHALRDLGAHVTVLDDLSNGTTPYIAFDGVLFDHASVLDAVRLRELASQNSIIFHCACRSLVRSVKYPYQDFEVNALGTLNVLQAAREFMVPVIYTSSSSVYGSSPDIPFTETALPLQRTPYAVSKLTGENLGLAYYESYGLPFTVLRLSNVYGPSQELSSTSCGVVRYMINDLLHERRPIIYGNGLQVRDFTYIDDVVAAILRSATLIRAHGQVFNVSSGRGTTILDLCKRLRRIIPGPEPVFLHPRDIDTIPERIVSNKKAHSVLDWKPRISLDDGLSRTVSVINANSRKA